MNLLILQELALKVNIGKNGGGTFDVFAIRVMLIKAILEPGKRNDILADKPETWRILHKVF